MASNFDGNDSDSNSSVSSTESIQLPTYGEIFNVDNASLSSGEDLEQSAEKDYQALPELDEYESRDLVDEEPSLKLTHENRVEAEKYMNERDERELQRDSKRLLPKGLFGEADDMTEFSEMKQPEISLEDEYADQYAENMTDLHLSQLKREYLRGWFNEPKNSEKVLLSLKGYIIQEHYNSLVNICATNSHSLFIGYEHLKLHAPYISVMLSEVPIQIIDLMNQAVNTVMSEKFPNYDEIGGVSVRIANWPVIDHLRGLRASDQFQFVLVPGIVVRRTSVLAKLVSLAFQCSVRKCRAYFVNHVRDRKKKEVQRPTANCPRCGQKARNIESKNKFINFQKITIQEPPGEVPPGRIPRSKDVVVSGDLVDKARPGDFVHVTGVLQPITQRNNVKSTGTKISSIFHHGNIYKTHIIGNNVETLKSNEHLKELTDEEITMLKKLARSGELFHRVIESIAPNVYGRRSSKVALALALFGGQEKISDRNRHRVRGDIHVLILGDSGTAKSQLLKFAEKMAPRSVYSTGKGASAVGLTAAVNRDPISREWVLEGGALVLADKGVCIIDEFDKMSDQDRVSIHEAMEQQSISISKAGIVSTLQARCSVIAAANPIKGSYNPKIDLARNVSLTDPIIQRFDLICVVRDIQEDEVDMAMARFVFNNHKNSGLENTEQDIDKKQIKLFNLDFLRRYLAFAKKINVRMGSVDAKKISEVYSELRQQSAKFGGIPIAIRHLESFVRVSQALARLNLRSEVSQADVDQAINIVVSRFIDAQRLGVQEKMRQAFSVHLGFKDENTPLLLYCLDDMERDVGEIQVKEFERKAHQLGITLYSLKGFYGKSGFSKKWKFLTRDSTKLIVRNDDDEIENMAHTNSINGFEIEEDEVDRISSQIDNLQDVSSRLDGSNSVNQTWKTIKSEILALIFSLQQDISNVLNLVMLHKINSKALGETNDGNDDLSFIQEEILSSSSLRITEEFSEEVHLENSFLKEKYDTRLEQAEKLEVQLRNVSQMYETDELMAQYLALHFGQKGESLDSVVRNHPDRDNLNSSLNFPVRVANILCSLLSEKKQNQRVLDVGCAVGGSSFQLASHENIGLVVAFDYSSSFIDCSNRILKGEEISYRVPVLGSQFSSVLKTPKFKEDVTKKITFLTYDATNLSRLNKGKFDGVLLANLLCRLPQPLKMLEALNDVVTEGGVVLFVSPFSWLEEFTPREKWITPDELKNFMESSGFSKVLEQDVPLIIREHERKYQYIISQGLAFRKA
eukprot:maker-scaffold_7-augustus-gene-10.15-mRNA-1 protein AED:0.09 eAED:0.09 QI:0/0.5/0.6/0.8/0/0/5/1043/1253